MLRGASWNNNDRDNLLSSNRNNDQPGNRNDNIGFRCVVGANGAYQLTPYDPAFEKKMEKAEDIINRFLSQGGAKDPGSGFARCRTGNAFPARAKMHQPNLRPRAPKPSPRGKDAATAVTRNKRATAPPPTGVLPEPGKRSA